MNLVSIISFFGLTMLFIAVAYSWESTGITLDTCHILKVIILLGMCYFGKESVAELKGNKNKQK